MYSCLDDDSKMISSPPGRYYLDWGTQINKRKRGGTQGIVLLERCSPLALQASVAQLFNYMESLRWVKRKPMSSSAFAPEMRYAAQ